MSEPFLGQILQVGFNFAPRSWALCAGQQLSIAQNSALFSLLGTSFGGNGTTTFALPNFQGRFPVGTGNGAGLSPVVIGETGGTQQVTLTVPNLPAHNHPMVVTPMQAASAKASLQTPAAGTVLARSVDNADTGSAPAIYLPAGTATDTALGGSPTVTCGLTGNNIPVATLPPFLGITTIIALQGIFPSRS